MKRIAGWMAEWVEAGGRQVGGHGWMDGRMEKMERQMDGGDGGADGELDG